MNVMYLCDNNYIDIAGVSVASLLENNKAVDNITIYLVADNITEKNLKLFRELIAGYGDGRRFVVIPKPNMSELIGCKVETHWWIENVFSRVFLEKVFEGYETVEKLIYIDCDTLVLDSLKELWDMDLKGYIGAGVCEAMGDLHKKAIRLKSTDNYFNGGVFLIDLTKWRKGGYDKSATNFIRTVNGKLEYADESVLNGILSNDLLPLSPRYNLTSLSIYFTAKEIKKYRKSAVEFTEKERVEAMENPYIVHFTSTFMDTRPWVEGSHNPFTNLWLDYYAMTPWKCNPLKKDGRSKKKLIATKMLLIMPGMLRLPIAGFLHAYIKPLKYISYFRMTNIPKNRAEIGRG